MATDARSNSAASAGRPRSEVAHQAILDATLELLAEVGFSALTVEGVAQRAGVGKATIYRRWPSKLPLVVEAFGELPAFEDVDTGGLAADLKAMLTPVPAELPLDAARDRVPEPRRPSAGTTPSWASCSIRCCAIAAGRSTPRCAAPSRAASSRRTSISSWPPT